jgi:putative tryptophan/tyrosine transport system substrate-binding protein
MLDMRRRDFVTYLGGAVASSVAARAQEPVGKAVRIGVLANEWWPPIESLREGLRELGYVESKSLRFDYRWAEGRNDRHPVLAAELVALPVDVIVTLGTPAALAAKGATSRIPIVMGAIGDPVRVGVVTNLARPGGNITGFSSAAFEMEEKRLELLKELLSGRLSRVAVFTTNNPALPLTIQYMQRAAAAFGVTLQPLEVNEAKDFDAAFGAIRRDRPDAAMSLADPFLGGHQARIAAFMAEIGLPAMYAYRHGVEAGGLISYTTNYHHLFRRAAGYIDRILKGTPPGELPVQLPTTFEMVINLRTARALGLEVPPTLLARADEVIE